MGIYVKFSLISIFCFLVFSHKYRIHWHIDFTRITA